MVRAVRGAIKVPKNTEEAIYAASTRLVKEIMNRNTISAVDIVSIIFSVTRDLDKANPASGLRKKEHSTEFKHTPLFCVQEAEIDGAELGMLRVLLTFNQTGDNSTPPRTRPVYLDGAEKLRSDIRDESQRSTLRASTNFIRNLSFYSQRLDHEFR